jgi:hypothetical protein
MLRGQEVRRSRDWEVERLEIGRLRDQEVGRLGDILS